MTQLEGKVNIHEPVVVVVDWEGENDPENPKNWTYRSKWLATGLVSLYNMLSPMSSSMISPAAAQVKLDLHATSSVFEPLCVSIYILAYAFGLLFFGPASQIFGRLRLVQGGNILFIAFNLGCAWSKTPSQILAARFLAGIGGSAPLVIGAGVINDCWSVQERGRAVTIYALAPLLGPIIGPIVGAWIASSTTWQWVFWSTTIAAVVIQIISFIWLKETFAPVLLRQKAAKLQRLEPIAIVRYITIYQADQANRPSIPKLLVYPFRLLLTEPIAQLLGIYLAYIVIVLLTSIAGIYTSVYHQSLGIAGLHYLALGLGLYGGAQIANHLLDRIHARLMKTEEKGRPEFRLPIMFPATILLPVGLLVTGWTARVSVHWIVPDIAISLLCSYIGIAVNWQAIQTYIIDTYTVNAAPALSGLSLLRSLVGFALPLCSPAMYRKLGYGLGDTVLAACAFGLGFPM
ncbi:hypothetical protein GYMLUDRAFT_158019 [Collybiopsis luxurians FD-317 M1]|nr:hypothetical protein GYMLUDRAFT_158019 [Collybiopsis luxurians FD-317 M1]